MTRADKRSMRGGLCVIASLLALSCGSLNPPTKPQPEPEVSRPLATPDPNNPAPTPVFGAPAPAATPTPSPTPTPAPGGGGGAEGQADCGQPLPPEITTLNVKIHLKGGASWTLDSTPLVGPDPAYCKAIGFTDGRSMCAVRPEGNPERAACELYATGRAADTARAGPTWYRNGNFCTGRASGCENHPDNQYLLVAYQPGTYKACARNGACGEVAVE